MFALSTEITIDTKYVVSSIQDVSIEKSINTVGSKAVIKLPASARLRANNKLQSNSAQTAVIFKRGMPVVIKLGYNSELNTEFVGYISSVGAGSPTVIECEGQEYLLKQPLAPKTFKDATLKDVIDYVVASKFSVNEDMPVVNLDSFVIKAGSTALQVFNTIKEHYSLVINVAGDSLFVGISEGRKLGEVKYSLNGNECNVVSDSDLKFRLAEEKKCKVKVVIFSKDNKKKEYEFGDADGELRTILSRNEKDSPEDIGKEALKKMKYTGFDGKIETFLFPYAVPAMVAVINDTVYTERSGSYYIISTKTLFSTRGGRREVQLGEKVSI